MKGQGLSITTIVVAAIALLILVVLVAVFTGQFGKFSTGIDNCENKGGVLELRVEGSSGDLETAAEACEAIGRISLPGSWGKTDDDYPYACCIDPNFSQ